MRADRKSQAPFCILHWPQHLHNVVPRLILFTMKSTVVLNVTPSNLVEVQMMICRFIQFEVTTVVTVKTIIFWNMTPCSLVDIQMMIA
jgi:hypothetical protein